MAKCLICGQEISDKDLLEGNFCCVTDSKKTPLNFICNTCYTIKMLELREKQKEPKHEA